ncbi:MAG: adenylate/guanylate cyclase domain-containing protein [Leptospirales bacterium]|nr:adenylate/guanylate cyclase domain-containing protein [Leptospirales bacterium]
MGKKTRRTTKGRTPANKSTKATSTSDKQPTKHRISLSANPSPVTKSESLNKSLLADYSMISPLAKISESLNKSLLADYSMISPLAKISESLNKGLLADHSITSSLAQISGSWNKRMFADQSMTENLLGISQSPEIFPTRRRGLPTQSENTMDIDQLENYSRLQREYAELLRKYEAKQADPVVLEREHERLSFQIRQAGLINRVSASAGKLIREREDFAKQFEVKDAVETTVVSIDIRRSTDLMLKAASPFLYAAFISDLSEQLKVIVTRNYGVFDKFTGDGILAFFPTFYSGSHSVYWALKAAHECHDYFRNHLGRHRDSFKIVNLEVGLGIGIDHGSVHLVSVNSEPTVIGAPVVYACRLSAARAYQTLLNQGAYAAAKTKGNFDIRFKETPIELKQEGIVLAYEADVEWKNVTLAWPDWDRDSSSEQSTPGAESSAETK